MGYSGGSSASLDSAILDRILYGRATQYVAPDGDDGNSGAADEPVLTVTQAVTNVPDNGRIVVTPGIYAGAVSLAGRSNIELILHGQITSDQQNTLVLGERCRLCGSGSVVSTATGFNRRVVYANGATGVRIEQVRVVGNGRGIYLQDCDHACIDRVSIQAGEYGVRLESSAQSTTGLVRECQIRLAGWDTCMAAGLFCVGMTKTALMKSVRNNIAASVPVGDESHPCSAISGYYGQVHDIGSSLYAAPATGTHAWCVHAGDGCLITLQNSFVKTGGGSPYALYGQGGTITVSGVDYEPLLTAGSIRSTPTP